MRAIPANRLTSERNLASGLSSPYDNSGPDQSRSARGGGAGAPPTTTSGGSGGRGPAAAPPADSHVYAAEKNKPLTIAAPGLLPLQPAANPGTPPPPARSAALDAPPGHGRVTIKPDGSFVYAPIDGFTGTDTFTYTATTAGVTSAAGTVTIVIR